MLLLGTVTNGEPEVLFPRNDMFLFMRAKGNPEIAFPRKIMSSVILANGDPDDDLPLNNKLR